VVLNVPGGGLSNVVVSKNLHDLIGLLAPGLYEPDWVVRRVRRLEGHQNKQMPPWTITRLPDSDLRDIVTYLTSNPKEPAVFNRKKGGGAGGAP
jgi:hypothetical protein